MKNTSISGNTARLFLFLSCMALLYYAALDTNKFGFYHDDGLYAVCGKSLAGGSGYKIESLPGEIFQTKYPPFYSAILSIIWRLFPKYPFNLKALVLPSILATLGYLWLAYFYFVRYLSTTPKTALFIVGLIGFNLRAFILSGSILSEALFTFLSFGALFAIESYMDKPRFQIATIATLLISLAVLTRTTGIGLILSVFLFALLRRKLPKVLPILFISCSVFAFWLLWAHNHAVDTLNPSLLYYTSYSGDLWEIVVSSDFVSIILRNLFMLVPISMSIVSFGFGYVSLSHLHPYLFGLAFILILIAFGLIVSGYIRTIRNRISLFHLFFLFYIAIHIPWPYSSYDRFLMPLLPFIIFLFVTELLRNISFPSLDLRKMKSLSVAPFSATVIATAIMLTLVFGNLRGIYRETVQSRIIFESVTSTENEISQWIRNNTQKTDIVVCYPDPRYYLSTGRKTIAVAMSIEPGQNNPQSIMAQIRQIGSSYIILNDNPKLSKLRPEPINKPIKAVLNAYPDRFESVFRADDSTIYRVKHKSNFASP